MSSELVRLRLPAPTRADWYAVWRIAWARVQRHHAADWQPVVHQYLHELLPDQEDRVLLLEPDALVFVFPDFGGAFSRTIGPLADWFALALAGEHRALLKTLAGPARPLRLRDLPRIDDALARPARTLLRTRGRLFAVHRDGDGPTLEALDGGDEITATDEEQARARALLLEGRTEDPLRTLFARRDEWRDGREEDERKELAAARHQLDAALLALPEAARWPVVLARVDDVADAWLAREAVALATPEQLAPHVAAHGVRVLALVDRAHARAKAAGREAWLPLVHAALGHSDPAVVLAALAVRLDAKHLTPALLSRVPLALVRTDPAIAAAFVPWLAAPLLRGPNRRDVPFDVAPYLDALAGHPDARARLAAHFTDRRWTGTPLQREVAAWHARLAAD